MVVEEGNASSSPSICGWGSWPLIMGALGGRDASLDMATQEGDGVVVGMRTRHRGCRHKSWGGDNSAACA